MAWKIEHRSSYEMFSWQRLWKSGYDLLGGRGRGRWLAISCRDELKEISCVLGYYSKSPRLSNVFSCRKNSMNNWRQSLHHIPSTINSYLNSCSIRHPQVLEMTSNYLMLLCWIRTEKHFWGHLEGENIEQLRHRPHSMFFSRRFTRRMIHHWY